MILINDKKVSKEFKITMKLKYNDNDYILYTIDNEVYHIGKMNSDKLVALSNEEFEELKIVIEKFMNG